MNLSKPEVRLRDEFAMAALTGLASSVDLPQLEKEFRKGESLTHAVVVSNAFRMADIALDERKRKNRLAQ